MLSLAVRVNYWDPTDAPAGLNTQRDETVRTSATTTQTIKTYAPELLRQLKQFPPPTADMQDVIIRCLAVDPAHRPSLTDLEKVALNQLSGITGGGRVLRSQTILSLRFNARDGT